MDNSEIISILQNMGTHVPSGTRLVLVGGGALALLGSPRPGQLSFERGTFFVTYMVSTDA